MRNTRDRIRHTVLFELIALVVVTPLGGFVFGIPMSYFGVVAVVSATIAMLWNYGFNLGFDHAMQRLFNNTRKTLAVRVVHAVLFEVGLVCLLVPFIAWYLGVSLWHAFAMDVALAGFYMIYAFSFSWCYDIVFPLPTS